MFEKFCLGKGIFGTTYFGINSKTYLPVVIKVQHEYLTTDYLLPETEVLIALKDNEEFPRYFLYDYLNKKYFIIESLYGPNLQSLLNLCG